MRNDTRRLLDIQEAIERVEKYVARGRETFDSDELIQTWVVHHLQIIGEAGRAISPEFRLAHAGIPWAQIIGMRHILVHHYFGIDVEAVWSAATADLPALRTQIAALLQPNDSNTEEAEIE